MDIPEDLREFIYEITKEMDSDFLKKMSETIRETMENPKKYFEENRENIELFKKLKESEEYKSSPAFRLNEYFQKICSESGYYDVFIYSMKRLSPSYEAYYEKLKEADRLFAEEFES